MNSPAVNVTGATTTKQWKGPVLDVFQRLVTEGQTSEAVALFEKLVARNEDLEEQLQKLLSRGHKSREGVSTAQLLLDLAELSAQQAQSEGAFEPSSAGGDCASNMNDALLAACGVNGMCQQPAEEKPKPKQPPVKQPFPEVLRRIDNPIAVPQEQRPCPQCGGVRTCIGHDVTERLELHPAEVVVYQDKQEKLACDSCDERHITRAPLPDKVVRKGRLGSSLVSQIIVDKYDDGLPLNRQKQRLERLGVSLSTSTLGEQVTWAAELLKPVWAAAQQRVLGVDVLHLDATGLPTLHREKKTHKRVGRGKRSGNLWGYVGGTTAVFLYCPTGHKNRQRGRWGPQDIGPEDFLRRRTGYVVADAAGVFDMSFKRENLIECGCNAHARRYFVKARDAGELDAAAALAAFKALYKIEKAFTDAAPAERGRQRTCQSQPIYEALLQWCRAKQANYPPANPLGRAVRYLLNNAEALMRFLEDGRVPIDNSIVERLHVRAALTRKNYLFAGSDDGGRRAAIHYTILGCCRLAGVNPEEYLRDVLPRLLRSEHDGDMDAMLPDRWAAARTRAG